MVNKAISSLLGVRSASPESDILTETLSEAVGYDVVSISAGKGGYRTDERGRVMLNDVDDDECSQTLMGEYK